MDIKYLKKMAKTQTIFNYTNKGMSEAEIDSLQQAIGKKFPQAYREFLFIGGKTANMFAELEHTVAGEDWKQLQQGAKAHLAKTELEVSADYWAFCSLYGGEQFFFFYFDDGDDPVTYIFESDGYSTPEITSEKQTFSQFVEWYIDYRQKNGY